MFFIAYVLCCLRLLELRTEGQTKKQKSLPKKLESTFSLILVNCPRRVLAPPRIRIKSV